MPYPSSGEVKLYDATPLASVPLYWICSVVFEVVQLTATLVMFAEATVPVPPATAAGLAARGWS